MTPEQNLARLDLVPPPAPKPAAIYRPAARQVGPANLGAHFGSLDRVIELLRLVNSAPDFYDHPKLINGCPKLFAEIRGSSRGIGARSAVGLSPRPGNIAVEIETIFELAPT